MNLKTLLLTTLAVSLSATIKAQVQEPARPKLVVGLVIDQMRWDYLYRYMSHYGEGGFKRLLNEGYSCENTRIPYVPSVTAIGHSCIYTGSVPSIHGIAGNNFVKNGKKVYCTDDANVKPVGTTNKAGLMSPRNLWVTTLGDELRMATNDQAKVVGVALKDRSSILPAGHNPNGAYWFDDETGHFITSTYYTKRLPKWVENFNAQGLVAKYLSSPWNTLYDKASYTQSTSDLTDYESSIKPGVNATLPLDLPNLSKQYGYGIIRNTPWGNTLTFDMAKAAVEGEELGTDNTTDLLTVSCSSTDYIGHQVGTNALETEDTYLRLDRDLAAFLSFLDQKVGRGQYLLFLTADHGAMNNARYLIDHRIPAGSWNEALAKVNLNNAVTKALNVTSLQVVNHVMNNQVFINHEVVASHAIELDKVKQIIVQQLEQDAAVLYAVDMDKVVTAPLPTDVKERIINGYNRERSGDIQIILKPAYSPHGLKGTDDGAWNPYDTHIPLVFMGWGITPGANTRQCFMTDIAPTIAAMLHIQAPSGCIGQPIQLRQN